MPNRISDSYDECEWDTDGDDEVAGSLDGAGTSAAGSRNLHAPGPYTLAGPSSSLVEHFVGMGFEEMILKAIKENGDGGADSLLELLLTYKVFSYDLVIGGSPCNNLACSNRHHRDGLEGEHSALFYHYFRILDSVKSIMGRM